MLTLGTTFDCMCMAVRGRRLTRVNALVVIPSSGPQDLRVRQRRRRRHAPRSQRSKASADEEVSPALTVANPTQQQQQQQQEVPPSLAASSRPRAATAAATRAVKQLQPSLDAGVTYAAALRTQPLPQRAHPSPKVRQLLFLGRLQLCVRKQQRFATTRVLLALHNSRDHHLRLLTTQHTRCISARERSTSSRCTRRAPWPRSAWRAGCASTSPRPRRSSPRRSSSSSATASKARTSEWPSSWTWGAACSGAATSSRTSPACSWRCRSRAPSRTAPSSSPCTTRCARTMGTSTSRSTARSCPSRAKTSSRRPSLSVLAVGRRAARSVRRRAQETPPPLPSSPHRPLSRWALLAACTPWTETSFSTRAVTA
mmetsp:Transcript_3700/g.8869  ORF Transcript_3700/g.8869 Transcript_3700/m.8869 type:complete len:370 (+) Transcript_3700:43-1152(+)